MDLLRLAFKENPKETSKILSKILSKDQMLIKLANKLKKIAKQNSYIFLKYSFKWKPLLNKKSITDNFSKNFLEFCLYINVG